MREVVFSSLNLRNETVARRLKLSGRAAYSREEKLKIIDLANGSIFRNHETGEARPTLMVDVCRKLYISTTNLNRWMEEIEVISALFIGRYRLKKKPQTQDHCDTEDQSVFQVVPGQDASSVPPTPIEDACKQVVQESADISSNYVGRRRNLPTPAVDFRMLRQKGISVLET